MKMNNQNPKSKDKSECCGKERTCDRTYGFCSDNCDMCGKPFEPSPIESSKCGFLTCRLGHTCGEGIEHTVESKEVGRKEVEEQELKKRYLDNQTSQVDKGRQGGECPHGAKENDCPVINCANFKPEVKDWDLKDKISEILVRWSMPTRQIAINEIVELFDSVRTSAIRERDAEIVEMIEKMCPVIQELKHEGDSLWVKIPKLDAESFRVLPDSIINSLSNSRTRDSINK